MTKENFLNINQKPLIIYFNFKKSDQKLRSTWIDNH